MSDTPHLAFFASWFCSMRFQPSSWPSSFIDFPLDEDPSSEKSSSNESKITRARSSSLIGATVVWRRYECFHSRMRM
eukprot:4700668-Heterocapsa_arctica.AAC.1